MNLNSKLILTLGFVLMLSGLSFAQQKNKPNILFIAVDDLKPDLNCYGFSAVKSPNIDRLAAHSTMFMSNYCQQAVCGPTRASLLTGLRPDRTQVWDLKTLIRDKNPNVVTLPQFFRQNGYLTAALGKIFDQRSVDKKHDAQSWSEPYKNKFTYPAAYGEPVMGFYQNPAIKKKLANSSEDASDDENLKDKIKISTECMDVPDEAYSDGAMVNEAIADLKKYGAGSQPFFLAVGIRKPHLPFVAPKKYWDLYDRSKIDLAKWQKPSQDGPLIAYHNSGELRNYNDIQPLDDDKDFLHLSEAKQRELIHGYYACISYTDALVGKLLNELKASGLDKNTIVVLWGDHGWHLGDHSLWNKHSNFEQATRTPFFISLPGQDHQNTFKSPTEYVDIYPTLTELAGLSTPKNLDGESLVPALKGNKEMIKEFAVSQYPRVKDKMHYMGYALRDSRYRYVEWVGNDFRASKPFNFSDVSAIELYDYETDPLETKNLANDPGYKQIKDKLAVKLHTYYKEQEQKDKD